MSRGPPQSAGLSAQRPLSGFGADPRNDDNGRETVMTGRKQNGLLSDGEMGQPDTTDEPGFGTV